MNALLDCTDQCVKGSGWKESVQYFEANAMLLCYGIKRDIEMGRLTIHEGRGFVQVERGKARTIKAPAFSDRVIQKVLNQKVILPELIPHLIYDNGASVKGKGNDFGRERFEAHIHKHFAERGDNGGYILFGDFTKYFDNLRHDRIKEMFRPFIPDPIEYQVFCAIIDSFRPDVSYMSDEEYESAMGAIYNSMQHLGYNGGKVKTLGKSCDIGAEISQSAGIYYTHEIDDYFKIVRGVKYYGRYMDDIRIIGDSVEELTEYRQELKAKADSLGIFLNERKTKIVPINRPFVWLKIKYTLTPSGHLVRCLDHDGIVRERKRIKYLAGQLREGIITRKYAESCYLCWRQAKKKFDSHRSIESLDRLYRDLIGPIDVYQKNRR